MTHTALKSTLILVTLLALSACETKVSSPVVRFQRQVSLEATQAPANTMTQAATTQAEQRPSTAQR